jgi:hypothetical protein
MSAYQAARAAEILGHESLPDGLTVEEIAVLQVHDDGLPKPSLSYQGAMGAMAEIGRVLRLGSMAAVWCKAMQGAIDTGELRQADGKITATEFKRWLDVQGDPPSLLIQSWFAVHARERKSPGGKWADEELAELRDYRNKFGTKAAAEKFGISEARIRQLLPTEKPPRKSHLALLELGKRTTMRGRKA